MERCVWWRESQSGRGDWRCVSGRGGALSVVMDGLTPTPTSSAMTSAMTSVVIIIHSSVLIISANSTMFFPCHFSLTARLLTPLFEDCLIENLFKNYGLKLVCS